MLRIVLAFVVALSATLASCATRTETKETCTPQFPPGPCGEGSSVPTKAK